MCIPGWKRTKGTQRVGGIPGKPAWQDSCWRRAQVIRHHLGWQWGWGVWSDFRVEDSHSTALAGFLRNLEPQRNTGTALVGEKVEGSLSEVRSSKDCLSISRIFFVVSLVIKVYCNNLAGLAENSTVLNNHMFTLWNTKQLLSAIKQFYILTWKDFSDLTIERQMSLFSIMPLMFNTHTKTKGRQVHVCCMNR